MILFAQRVGSISPQKTIKEYLKVLEGADFVAPALSPGRIESVELAYTYQWQNANINLTLFSQLEHEFNCQLQLLCNVSFWFLTAL